MRFVRIRSTLILVFICSNILLSFAQKENWEDYIINKAKGPMAFTVNMNYYLKKPKYKNLLIVGTYTNKCFKNGYPNETGLKKLHAFSDSIANIVDKVTKSRLAGIITYQCTGFDVFHVKDTIGLRDKLSTFMSTDYNTSKNYLEIKADKRLSYLTGSLLPNDLSNDFFVNHELLTDLVHNGDDLTKPRRMEHWLYFREEKKRQMFIDLIEAVNFKVDSTKYEKGAYYPFELKMSRVDSVNPTSIAELTSMLKKVSNNFHGTYDGWSVALIKKD